MPSRSARCLSQYTAIIVLYTCKIGCLRCLSVGSIFPYFLAQLPAIISCLFLNIYVVCSLRTLLALALAYISLLPLYETLSILLTYFAIILLSI